jgi:hypothetical protein
VWELYDGTSDWTQAHDLAAEHPDKLAKLQRPFLIQAARFNVLPLDDRMAERLIPGVAGRPSLLEGTSQRLYEGMGAPNENCVLDVKNRSHQVTAQLRVPDGGGRGAIVNQGGITGGWSQYVKDGRPAYTYSFCGIQRYTVTGDTPLPDGEHQLRMEFAYDGGGLGKGGDVTLYITLFTFDETTDVGRESGSPVTDDYPARGNGFTGTVRWVQIDLGADDPSHLIPPNSTSRSP